MDLMHLKVDKLFYYISNSNMLKIILLTGSTYKRDFMTIYRIDSIHKKLSRKSRQY